jgi:hypothetical protein
MNVETALLSKILASGNGSLDAVLDKGVNAQMFHDDDCAKVFDHVVSHKRRYGETPSIEAVKESHPRSIRVRRASSSARTPDGLCDPQRHCSSLKVRRAPCESSSAPGGADDERGGRHAASRLGQDDQPVGEARRHALSHAQGLPQVRACRRAALDRLGAQEVGVIDNAISTPHRGGEHVRVDVLTPDAFIEHLAERVADHIARRSANGGARWLTAREAADYLGLPSPNALHKLTSAKAIPFSQEREGGRLYFAVDDLDRWRRERVQGPR